MFDAPPQTPIQQKLSLARKYRPKFLKDLIGQEILVKSLVQGIEEKRLPQAILLHGIRGTGKTSTARILARSVNCVGLDGKGDMTITPCGICPSCKAIDTDSHVDVIEMDAASHTGVDDIREVIDSARYKAVIGRYKVFIIDEVHMLSKSAFNALLKTLEEPPSHVLFIFATTEINKVPETILSRCARFDLKRVDSKTLISHLQAVSQKEHYTLEPDAGALIARFSEGSVRDSLTLLDQAMSCTTSIITPAIIQNMVGFGDRQKTFHIISSLIKRDVAQVIQNVRTLIENGTDPLMVMQDILEALYQIACFKTIPSLTQDISIPEFERTLATELAQQADAMQWLSLWNMILKSYQSVKNAPFQDQAVEMGLIRACFAAQMPSIEQLCKNFEIPTVSDGKSDNPDTSEQSPIYEQPFNNSEISVTSEDDLFALLNNYKEIVLLSILQQCVAFVSFEVGHIRVCSRGEKNGLATLKQFLKKITGTPWIIEEVADSTAKTFFEKQQDHKHNQEQEILQNPLIQNLTKAYPGSEIKID